MGATLASLANAAALLEQWFPRLQRFTMIPYDATFAVLRDLAQETATRAEALLREQDDQVDEEQVSESRESEEEKDAEAAGGKNDRTRKSADGGKRGWRKAGQGDTRENSLKVFFATKREEQAREVALVRNFVEKKKSDSTGSFDLKALRRNVNNLGDFILGKYFPRLLFFNDNQDGISSEPTQAVSSAGTHLVASLRASFGLDQHLARVFKQRQLASGNPKANALSAKSLSRGVNKLARGVASSFDDLFDKQGKLRFPKVFKADKPTPAGRPLPVYMEICSGNGEWAAAQAKESVGQANWVTVELR